MTTPEASTVRRVRIFHSPIFTGLWRWYCECCDHGRHAYTHQAAVEAVDRHLKFQHKEGG